MGRLYEVTDQLKVPLFEKEKVEEMLEEAGGRILYGKENAERVGKGYEYPVKGRIEVLGYAGKGTLRTMYELAGY